MTRFYDGKFFAEFEFENWISEEDVPDWSGEFFEVGSLEYLPEVDAYKVDDVEYLLDRANDYEWGKGEFFYDDPKDDVVVIASVGKRLDKMLTIQNCRVMPPDKDGKHATGREIAVLDGWAPEYEGDSTTEFPTTSYVYWEEICK